MKKYFLTAILSLLVATVFTSCGDNDIIEGTEKPSSELKVWVEPYHIKGASLDEVTTYMNGHMIHYNCSSRPPRYVISCLYVFTSTCVHVHLYRWLHIHMATSPHESLST